MLGPIENEDISTAGNDKHLKLDNVGAGRVSENDNRHRWTPDQISYSTAQLHPLGFPIQSNKFEQLPSVVKS